MYPHNYRTHSTMENQHSVLNPLHPEAHPTAVHMKYMMCKSQRCPLFHSSSVHRQRNKQRKECVLKCEKLHLDKVTVFPFKAVTYICKFKPTTKSTQLAQTQKLIKYKRRLCFLK